MTADNERLYHERLHRCLTVLRNEKPDSVLIRPFDIPAGRYLGWIYIGR